MSGGTNGYPIIPGRWEGGFYIKLRVNGRLTADGFEANLVDVGNAQAMDFGTIKFRKVP